MDTLETLKAQAADLLARIDALSKADRPATYEPGRFVKFDQEKRLVYAEIYLPDVEDAHGHSMTAAEIEKMAHNFMANARTMMIDVNHDNSTDYGCYMVESFIARAGDPDYYPGAWVGAVFVGSDEIWSKVKSGDLTGFSFEGVGFLMEELPDAENFI